MAIDLNGISVFLAVAEARSFRVAAENLGVTRPAVSQTIRRLEDRLGVALVRRTTRSVSFTEADEQLYHRVAPAISEVGLALDTTADRDSAPSSLLRLAVSSIAEQFISGPLLARFADTFSAIQIDVTVTDEEFDIVAEGYDAGVRLDGMTEVEDGMSACKRELYEWDVRTVDFSAIPTVRRYDPQITLRYRSGLR